MHALTPRPVSQVVLVAIFSLSHSSPLSPAAADLCVSHLSADSFLHSGLDEWSRLTFSGTETSIVLGVIFSRERLLATFSAILTYSFCPVG